MAIRRVHREVSRTPEEMAELEAIRDRIQRDRPGPDDAPSLQRHGDVLALLSVLSSLKRERERRGLTLDEVSRRSGIDKGMLSRLENGKVLNPTVGTLHRYAEAVGATLSMVVQGASA
jgi:DNA-binding XRE family transcriptional regulator